MLTDELEWCGLLWCFSQLFGLSFWRHPFTTKDLLVVSKWCNAKFLQIYSNQEKPICILEGLRASTFSANWHFWVKYSLKKYILFWMKWTGFLILQCYGYNNQIVHDHIPYRQVWQDHPSSAVQKRQSQNFTLRSKWLSYMYELVMRDKRDHRVMIYLMLQVY